MLTANISDASEMLGVNLGLSNVVCPSHFLCAALAAAVSAAHAVAAPASGCSLLTAVMRTTPRALARPPGSNRAYGW